MIIYACMIYLDSYCKYVWRHHHNVRNWFPWHKLPSFTKAHRLLPRIHGQMPGGWTWKIGGLSGWSSGHLFRKYLLGICWDLRA